MVMAKVKKLDSRLGPQMASGSKNTSMNRTTVSKAHLMMHINDTWSRFLALFFELAFD
jgi:hypothetical protein